MKYVKVGNEYKAIISKVMDSRKALVFSVLDKDKIVDGSKRKYCIIDTKNPKLIVAEDVVEIPDSYPLHVYGQLLGHINDSTSLLYEQEPEMLLGIEAGNNQLLSYSQENITHLGICPEETPLDIEWVSNPMNASNVFVKAYLDYCSSNRLQVHRFVLYQSLSRAVAHKTASLQNKEDAVDIVSFDIGTTKVYALLQGWRREESMQCTPEPGLVCNMLSDSTAKMKLLKEEYKVNPTVQTKFAILDCHNDILDAKDSLQQIKDEEDYTLVESDNELEYAAKFEEDNKEEIAKFLEDNPGNKIVKKDGQAFVVSEDVETEDFEETKDSALEGYKAEKVNNTTYNVTGPDGTHVYTLEKKASKWTCNCLGFKHRSNCKHLGLLADVLPKRHPRQKIDDILPEIKELLDPFGRWEVVGSYRRGVADFKDIDILVECEETEFENILPELQKDPNYEPTMSGKHLLRGKYKGFDFDLTRVDKGEWGSYLLYRTGPVKFNLKTRGTAKAKGWRLNEHGLFDENANKIAGDTEESIFKALGLSYLEPNERD